ncbi:hypothetical protein F5Y08DRAFT_318342 [Xylaria arbuscula]|nr:hypothetical protein F5Y08DRAFT_318342 [Xylaria arbuscula]
MHPTVAVHFASLHMVLLQIFHPSIKEKTFTSREICLESSITGYILTPDWCLNSKPRTILDLFSARSPTAHSVNDPTESVHIHT